MGCSSGKQTKKGNKVAPIGDDKKEEKKEEKEQETEK